MQENRGPDEEKAVRTVTKVTLLTSFSGKPGRLRDRLSQ
jgi:hypothetical protein